MSDASDSIHQKGVSICKNAQEENCQKEPSPDGGEIKKSRISEEMKSVLIFTATSAIAGYAGFLLTPAKPSAIPTASLLLVLGAMIAVFLGTFMLIQKLLGKKNMQWIMGNGGAIYLFLWFVTWIIFYNAL